MSRLNQNFASIDTDNQINMNNGRIDLLSEMPEFDIPAYNQKTVDNSNFFKEATSGQIVRTNLSDLYFSNTNIEALQQAIRYRVYVETNGNFVIGRQSDQELKIIMRSLYYQYAKNDGSDCVGQVQILNSKVLDWAVPEILSNLLQYQVYKRDASTLPVPMELGSLETQKGTKILEQKSFM